VARKSPELPQLKIITSGSLPPNPAELLGSERMSQLLTELTSQVDVVVIDTPPSLVADAQILAAKVDAVLFVVQPGKTKSEAAAAALELFKRAGARVIGTVLNRIPRSRSYYYGGYSYYSPYAGKGYYAKPAPESGPGGSADIEPVEPQPSSGYSFLQKVSRLSNPLEEMPPPDPPKA
jgi:Mrp family chromosome partitioning ATPase